MNTWTNRPREIRNLFNPAFCGLLLHRTIHAYNAERNQPMPFSLTLLVLPLCLHEKSRGILSQNVRSYFSKIIQNHPEILVGYPERAHGLLPYTFEALGLLHSLNTVSVTLTGGFVAVDDSVKKVIKGSNEVKECQNVARSLGKKFAVIDDRATIYTSLGVRP